MYRSIFAAILAVTSAGAYAADGAEQLEKAHSRVTGESRNSIDQQNEPFALAKKDREDYPPT